MNEKEAATQKAKDLIRMAVSKAKLIRPQKEETLKVIPSAFIIGGGVSGMTAALNLADQGFKVYLIEKEKTLGGNLNNLNILYPIQEDASNYLKEIIDKVENHKNIEIHLCAFVQDGFPLPDIHPSSVIHA